MFFIIPHRLLIVLLFACICLTGMAQPIKWKNRKYFTVVSYNVENLFDTVDNPHKNDNAFLPDSKKAYNTEKYFRKIENIATVIHSINSSELPEIVGLTEVENRAVLVDLISNNKLKKANYQIILEEGPDPRGIECALLYRPDEFAYISHKAIEVRFESNRRTRDILYVKGIVKRDTVHLFVNHWTSRRSGTAVSEKKRKHIAKVLKFNIDSLLLLNIHSKIIIMGDFNDEPIDKSLYEVLDAGSIKESKLMINLMFDLQKQGIGSYYYRGKYLMLDNLIVTTNLTLNPKGFRLFENRGWIYMPDFMCYTHKNGDKAPAKSYGGSNYYGGFSDHFPIYTIFYQK